MHRTVNSESVIQFASNVMTIKPVKILKSEVVEYKRGTMLSSSGTVKITVNGPVQPSPLYGESISDEVPTYDESFGTSELSGSGQYSLKLEKCYPKPSVVRRSVNKDELTESRIFATFNNGNQISTPFLLHPSLWIHMRKILVAYPVQTITNFQHPPHTYTCIQTNTHILPCTQSLKTLL